MMVAGNVEQSKELEKYLCLTPHFAVASLENTETNLKPTVLKFHHKRKIGSRLFFRVFQIEFWAALATNILNQNHCFQFILIYIETF